MSTSEESLAYGVIIVGGGPAGCSTALSILKTNRAVSLLLIDDADSEAFKIGESLPAEALNQTIRFLSPTLHAKVFEDISAGHHLKCTGNASAWSTPSVHETHSIMNPFGMGLHLDRARFDESMRQAVIEYSQTASKVKVKKGKAVQVDHDLAGRHRVTVQGSDSTETYSASWIIDATGRKASIARQFGAKPVKSDALLSFYALFYTSPTSAESDRDHRALIEASKNGWWYTSKLSENRRVVAYHTDDTDTTCKIARKLEGFLDLLRSDTFHINRIVEEHEYEIMGGYPKTTAANSTRLEPSYCSDEGAKWCAVGDAAMAFDPLSSQGMMTALRIGAVAGMTIGHKLRLEGVREGGDNGPWPPAPELQVAFDQVKVEYEKHKKYYYSVVDRFDGEFWSKRKN
ncbi:hypothetical protein FRC03_011881 [Tulasnella sp. 419]|nr:hypothetical protein FRC03_011881 [Tulasnella sp. 419]